MSEHPAWHDVETPEDLSDALANVVWALDQMHDALDDGRYNFGERHVRADLSYLRAEARRAKRQQADAYERGQRDLAAKVEALAERFAAAEALSTRLLVGDLRALLADALPQDADSEPGNGPLSAERGETVATDVRDVAGLSGTHGGSEEVECCASGRCEVCTPGYDWGRDG